MQRYLLSKQLNKELNIRFHFYFTSLLAFLLPIYPPLIPPAIALLVINWIAGGNFIRLFKNSQSKFYFFLFISLYLLYCTGLIYSENKEYGLKDLETKLSLLLFPIVYFSSEKLNAEKIRSLFAAFTYGCAAAALLCFGNAVYQYFHVKYLLAQNIWAYNYGINFFLKDRISAWMHPSYISMYFAMALYSIYFFRKENADSSIWKKYFIPAVLSVFILLFNSKAGILSLFLLGSYICWQLIVKERKFKLAALIITSALSLFSVLYFTAPEFEARIKGVFNSFSPDTNIKTSEESTASRIAIWKAAKIVISENFLTGTGTGDVKDELINEYKKEEMTFALQQNLNAHSQFLQTFAAIGIAGFFSLFAALFIPLFREWKKQNSLYIVFLLLMILNLLAESMFETQAGVVFYAFFNSLLLFSHEPAPKA